MKKYVITILLLTSVNIFLSFYLQNIVINQDSFEYVYKEKPIIYQKKDIELNNIEEFKFEEYFEILNFNENSYSYNFKDDYLSVKLKDINEEFVYDYVIIEPEVIETIKYQTITEYVYPEYVYDQGACYIEADTYELSFESGTDIANIIHELGDIVYSSDYVTCDYSSINPNSVGTYKAYFYSDCGNIEILVKII